MFQFEWKCDFPFYSGGLFSRYRYTSTRCLASYVPITSMEMPNEKQFLLEMGSLYGYPKVEQVNTVSGSFSKIV